MTSANTPFKDIEMVPRAHCVTSAVSLLDLVNPRHEVDSTLIYAERTTRIKAEVVARIVHNPTICGCCPCLALPVNSLQ